MGDQSGLSLRDATLLKIQVTHGVELKVPLVGKLMTSAMLKVDPANALFSSQGQMAIAISCRCQDAERCAGRGGVEQCRFVK